MSKLIIGDLTAVIQIRFYLAVDENGNYDGNDQSYGKQLQDALEQPAQDTEKADKEACKLFQYFD